MTNEEVVKMLKAKVECMERIISPCYECNTIFCKTCKLQYEQGNIGQQKEALKLAIDALEKQAN